MSVAVKTCRNCGLEKSVDDFYVERSTCKRCHCAQSSEYSKRNRSRRRAAQQRYRRENPSMQRAEWLRRTFGLSLDDYDEMLDAQGGQCAICCRSPEQNTIRRGKSMALAVDHDHVTGVIRGLLCNSCNRGLGFLLDDVDLLRRALAYLEGSQ